MSDSEVSSFRVGILRRAGLLALLLPLSVSAAEALRNGGFETGDLAGWTAGSPAGSSVTVVSSFFHEREHRPKEGSKFALLKSPPKTTASTSLIQSFHAEAGAVISGWAIFRSGGKPPVYFSGGAPLYEVIIRGSGYERSVFSNDNGESTPWAEWKYTLPADGDYVLEATVSGGGRYIQQDSYLGLDGVTVTPPTDTKAPVVTPPKDIRVEIPAREKSAPASHPDIVAFLNAATANDERDGALTAKAVNPPASFTVEDTAVTFEAVDAAGNKGTASARVTVVQAPNRLPIAVDDSATTRSGIAATLNVTANDSDPDGDALAAELAKPPAHGRAELNRDGTLRYTPESGFTGDDRLTYAVLDGQGGRAEATVRIAVAVVDSPPADVPPVAPPPPVEPVPTTPTVTEVKNPNGSVTWSFRGEIVEHEVNYHPFTANKDWLYVFEIGDGKNPAQWIRVDPGGRHAPRESTSYAVKTRRRFAWVPAETKDYRVQVWAAKGPYVLTVTGRADDHGNDWQHATPVTLGQIVAGELWEVLGSDVDVFSFQGVKGGIYRIETQQPENPGGYLRVYDRQRGGATREATSGEKPSRSVTFNTPRDDTYYIQVWGGVGKYTLRVTRLK